MSEINNEGFNAQARQQKKEMAIRSNCVGNLDFSSIPMVGLIGVARTASEGASKYGRFNYAKGMLVHECLDHAFAHMAMFLLGDRSEPHLEHAAWNLLAASQSNTLDPELNAPHLLSQGATIGTEMMDLLESAKNDLAEFRKTPAGKASGDWKVRDLQHVRKILEQRVSLGSAQEVESPIQDDINLDDINAIPVCVGDEVWITTKIHGWEGRIGKVKHLPGSTIYSDGIATGRRSNDYYEIETTTENGHRFATFLREHFTVFRKANGKT